MMNVKEEEEAGKVKFPWPRDGGGGGAAGGGEKANYSWFRKHIDLLTPANLHKQKRERERRKRNVLLKCIRADILLAFNIVSFSLKWIVLYIILYCKDKFVHSTSLFFIKLTNTENVRKESNQFM